MPGTPLSELMWQTEEYKARDDEQAKIEDNDNTVELEYLPEENPEEP